VSAPVRILEGLADLVLPRRCVQCGRAGAWLCPVCAPGLRPLPPTVCLRCGAPLARPAPSCPECRGRSLAFGAARAAFVYEGPARRLVTACKFRALRSLADEMAALAAPRFGELVAALGGEAAVSAVTWVPLHRERGLERGFDQARLLARGLARRHGLRCEPLLVRRRRGRRQSGLAAAARRDNVRGAFELRKGSLGGCFDCGEKVKNVVVVDDVYTTGETLQQCSQVLRRAGCEPYVFTFARAARRRASGDELERTAKEQGR
jgi:ComF family protein